MGMVFLLLVGLVVQCNSAPSASSSELDMDYIDYWDYFGGSGDNFEDYFSRLPLDLKDAEKEQAVPLPPVPKSCISSGSCQGRCGGGSDADCWCDHFFCDPSNDCCCDLDFYCPAEEQPQHVEPEDDTTEKGSEKTKENVQINPEKTELDKVIHLDQTKKEENTEENKKEDANIDKELTNTNTEKKTTPNKPKPLQPTPDSTFNNSSMASLRCRTIEGPVIGKECVFPFFYDGKSFDKCVSTESGKSWCSTKVDHGNFTLGHWGICNRACPKTDYVISPPQPAGRMKRCKTEGGEGCVFPFYYRDAYYTTCTPVDMDKPWCVTKVDDRDNFLPGFWDFCEEDCPGTWPTLPVALNARKETIEDILGFAKVRSAFGSGLGDKCTTVDGPVVDAECVFPFVYKGITHRRCTTSDRGEPWCSTHVNSEHQFLRRLWGFCHEDCPVEPDVEVRAKNRKPGRRPVRPMTNVPDPMMQVRDYSDEVKESLPHEDCWTVAGPEVGKNCVFPFYFEDEDFHGCVSVNGERPWCATAVDEIEDFLPGRWGFCGEDCPIA